MTPFPGLDAFPEFLPQPFQNLAIRRTANIHGQKMVLAETGLAEEFLEYFKLCVRLTRAHDDEGLGVVLRRAEGILHDPVSPHPAELWVHNGVIDIEVGFDVKREDIHVRVLERRRQALAVTNDHFNSHEEKACLSLHSPAGEDVSNTESNSTRPCPLLILRGAGNTIAFVISQFPRIRRQFREKRSNFAEESAQWVIEKRRARERVTNSVPLPFGTN